KVLRRRFGDCSEAPFGEGRKTMNGFRDSAVLDRLETSSKRAPEYDSETEHASCDVQSYGLSDIGRVRSANEDRFLIAELRTDGGPIHVFAVADGMGGHAGGQRASALALETLDTLLHESLKGLGCMNGARKEEMLSALKTGIEAADARVCSEGRHHPELHAMGSTLTLACLCGDELLIAHVGDSRCYLCRDGALHQLTSDQT